MMTTRADRRALIASGASTASLIVVRRTRNWRTSVSVNVILICLGVIFVLPLLWMMFASLDSRATWSLSLPHLTLANFAAVLHGSKLHPFVNSLYIAGVASTITCFAAVLAGYALSRRHVPLKRTWLLAVLFASSLPVTMEIVPTYQLFVTLNWVNSLFYIALFLAAASLPFAIWLMKSFIDQVPEELLDAAELEGATSLRVLTRVIVPLVLPGIAVTAIVTFVSAWNAFLVPLVLDSVPSQTPAAIAVYSFLPQSGPIYYGQLAAYSVLYALPVVVMYLASARWLNEAFAFGGGVNG